MGYEVHIVRTADWVDAGKKPVTKADIDALIASDHELAWSMKDYIDIAVPSEKKTVKVTTRYPAITWNGVSMFWWQGEEIVTKNSEPRTIAKMIAMARPLRALVVGDEGETYALKKGIFGSEKIMMTTPEGKTSFL